ncbi:alkaline phosphatase family protein [Paraflavitalea soli]|uniref:Alkaline phosphatase family protein n=1 Tax=Paraflavitalea soli TaxID=2315862 RepID=A0A3B7MVJ3_9BACT|nr:alkaline phosphatase PafA [Paraflavitalea soli]AXY78118.1 alkaline phosphatase family protein [Paraflavitalea soli]
MRKLLLSSFFVTLAITSFAQRRAKTTDVNTPNRPKLVVGIVVDQMRWDYLYRYYDRYKSDGGFKRFLQQGFTAENTLIPYTPTITACGHTCIYTGSVPAVHGITGNAWWDRDLQRSVYCAEDKTVKSVGTTGVNGEMSPRNMLTNTICDELRLATNFRSKVVGIAIKDRGGILPAGHSANAAYWYDSKTGDWITSTYYMNDLPQWVKDFNAQKVVDKYYALDWNLLYPKDTYVQSTADEKPYEGKSFGADQKGFPYDLKKFIGKNYGAIASTPYGNSMTADMAKAAVINEQLGADDITDFLAVSFSSPDYVGHSFGPNSIEQEDDFLRLDTTFGNLFRFLDEKVGKGEYLVFLSADHGVAHVPGFMKENKLPGGTIDDERWAKEINKGLLDNFGITGKAIVSNYNYQIHLNHALLDSMKLDKKAVKQWIVDYLGKQEGISRAFAIDEIMNVPLTSKQREMMVNGWYPRRSGDIQIVLQPGWIDGGPTGTTHGIWNPYDAHIPMLFYGWGIKPGRTNRETYMSDIAPTIAALLHIQMPNGTTGKVVEEVMK